MLKENQLKENKKKKQKRKKNVPKKKELKSKRDRMMTRKGDGPFTSLSHCEFVLSFVLFCCLSFSPKFLSTNKIVDKNEMVFKFKFIEHKNTITHYKFYILL